MIRFSSSSSKIKADKGFSLIELIIVMGLLGILLAITAGNFATLLSSLKTTSKVAETEIEKIVGLDILRQDIEHTGYGLPWDIDTGNWGDISYLEAASQNICSSNNNISDYNDTTAPPRGIISGDNVCDDGSDYLVIKSTIVRNNEEAQKWTYIWNDGSSNIVNIWASTTDNMDNSTKVIAINPKDNIRDKVLVTYLEGGSRKYYSPFGVNGQTVKTNYALKPTEVFLLFGIGDDTSLRMPFNRADYYISRSNVPSRCANGTGVLTKAIVSHSNGQLSDFSPLLDCVADFQVVFGVDITTPSPDGIVDCYTNDLSNTGITDAENTRERVKELRVYILAHEGQMDRNFRFDTNSIRVGDNSGLNVCGGSGVLGRDFNLTGITNWQNYRWKVYTLVVLPDNLKGR